MSVQLRKDRDQTCDHVVENPLVHETIASRLQARVGV